MAARSDFTVLKIESKSALDKTLTQIQYALGSAFQGGSLERDGAEFWSSQVRRDTVEYRLVSQLPAHCPYADRLGNEFSELGCTRGSITYLIENVAKQAEKTGDYTQLALLITRERLTAFTKNEESPEVISDLVDALKILTTKYWKAVQAKSTEPVFTDEDLEVVNRIPFLQAQIAKKDKFNAEYVYLLTKHGGRVRQDSKVGENVIVGLGSEVLNSMIEGDNIVIRDSSVSTSTIRGSRILLEGASLFQVEADVRDLVVKASSLNSDHLTINTDNVKILNSQVRRGNIGQGRQVLARISGSNFTWDKVLINWTQYQGEGLEHYADAITAGSTLTSMGRK